MRNRFSFTVLFIFSIFGNDLLAQETTPVVSGKNVTDGIQIYE
ncbi:hypothetical protein [Gracilimonas halophila]|uniref:Uncharacterized protein n=1 Tax=Gracilimonas halophila TaxID=1834464 RepID=A0ABW5JKW8_9BACT